MIGVGDVEMNHKWSLPLMSSQSPGYTRKREKHREKMSLGGRDHAVGTHVRVGEEPQEQRLKLEVEVWAQVCQTKSEKETFKKREDADQILATKFSKFQKHDYWN